MPNNMKSFFIAITTFVVGLSMASCSGQKDNDKAENGDAKSKQSVVESPDSSQLPVTNLDGKKAAVYYFSATGTTKQAAEQIAKATGTEAKEIVPKEAYTKQDLDWTDQKSRCYVEMHSDGKARPALKDKVPDLSQYDVVFIGYPNWWNTAPMIIYTFMDEANLTGKTIVPFMTSGGDEISKSVHDLRQAYPQLNIQDGILMNGITPDDLVDKINSNVKS